MDATAIYSILALGFGLGLLHALDADHIMAISSMATPSNSRNRWSIRTMLGFCFRWALGHSAILLSLSLLLLFARLELPAAIPLLAEKLIGLFLIGIGTWILWNIRRNRLVLQIHRHHDITHVHLTDRGNAYHNHQPILVGIIHGLAGSAPVLALIPALHQTRSLVGILYVLLFCLGVLISMLAFGLFFRQVQNWIVGFGQRVFQGSRLVIGSMAIAFGSYWLLV